MPVNNCPVCCTGHLSSFLRRRQVPVHQNLIVPDREAALTVARGELDFAVCVECGFVFNRTFDPAKLAYGDHYDNTQSCSAYFDAYLDDLAKNLVEAKEVRNSNVVEVGCGKGAFLRKLVCYPGSSNQGIGFDPSYLGPDSDLDGRLSFRRCYYDSACSDIPADVVICRHVIEHVSDPLALLRSVHSALVQSPTARVFIETPCVEWILRNRVVWDLFYEHCSLFSTYSLSLLCYRAGFHVEHVTHVFCGQYLWLEARASGDACTVFRTEKPDVESLAHAYAADEQALRDKWRSRMNDLKRRGKLALWGAGAKGVTFANLADPQCTFLDCVVDINPNKQGSFIPGTGHPIVSPDELVGRDIRNVILLNPNYRSENRQLLADAGINCDLIDWSE